MKIIILEGIAGAGKTSALDKFKGAVVYKEEDLLFDWNINFTKGITQKRIKLFNDILDNLEDKTYVFERFHISLKILDFENSLRDEYEKLLEKLKKLDAEVQIFTLNKDQLQKALHEERDDDWKQYLKKKMQVKGFDDILQMYKAEQELILKLAKEQSLLFLLTKSL